MRVGYGFSYVTFRPSRVFHSRVFSYLSVDTDEQSRAVRRRRRAAAAADQMFASCCTPAICC